MTKISEMLMEEKKIYLHSEASFSPSQPEIVWFYCIRPPETDSGDTLYCDGIKLWEEIPAKFKLFFLKTQYFIN